MDGWNRVLAVEVNQAGPEAPNSKSLSLVGINSPSLLYLLSEDLESWAVEERRATDRCLQGKWTFAAELFLPWAPLPPSAPMASKKDLFRWLTAVVSLLTFEKMVCCHLSFC